MSAPQDRKNTSKDEPTTKRYNEYPLEGDPNRPAVIINNLLWKSPGLIRRNDESIEQRALSARPDLDEEDTTELHIGPQREVVNEVAFGLLGIAAKEVTKEMSHLEEEQTSGEEPRHETDDNELVLKGIEKAAVAAAQTGSVTLPQDDLAMRDSELYQLALRSLFWQRDNYLVGKEYADQRNTQRRRVQQQQQPHQHQLDSSFLQLPFSRMPYDATALGNRQLVQLGSWFIPSPTVHHALLPIVVGLPTGALNEPILRATVNLIPLSQNYLNHVVKNRILWFLKDEHWRKVIKNSAKGYINNTYRDSPT